MVGLIFGIIFLAAGIVGGVILARYKTNPTYKRDNWGNLVKDENGNYIIAKDGDRPVKKFAPIAYVGGAILGALCVFGGCIANVGTGKTGVVTTFGKIENYTLESGFHLTAPWRSVTEIDTTINELKFSTPTYTKDSQTVDVEISVQYRISTTDTFSVVADNGLKSTQETLEAKLKNRITSAIKTIISTRDATDLLVNRASLVTDFAQRLDEFSDDYYVIISATNITNIDFTDEFEAAVAAKVAQQQAYEKALIEQQQALAQAENEKKIKTTEAEAAAEVAKIQAQADMEVAKIAADSAEYQGRKDAAIKLQALASVNGWTVVSVTKVVDGIEVTYNKLYKSDETPVTQTELQAGVQNLLKSEYYNKWNGELPQYYMDSDGNVSTVLIPGGDN